MKSIKHIVISFLLIAGFAACEEDNYPGPDATFKGAIIDAETGEPFQTAIGGTGVRIRMMEYSWSETPAPYDLYVMMDGRFNNNKVFKGNYGVTPSGAFVALPEEVIEISGTVEKNYEVDPFLRVEWVGEPVINNDGTATIQVQISRGTNHPDYQQALAEVWLFVSETQYVGDFSYSPNYSTRLTGATLPALGGTVSITTGWPGGIGTGSQRTFPDYARKYFLRVGARIDKQVNSTNVYNYSTVKEITTN
ncbi:DUF3823 domain-containing protein [Chryseosolibacter indicus]|uniref:DUF3823 domain-containing protein n=1 Tax=Chryseosolibacter indicus TaxID=2782351 RepID=A0ABS5VXJ9_9BACT|nr:DUF3823 domain-containing protein [Chryseosolibacter indicus]MBT1705629.1 DUF3823 domain-containing protein [Chryseosolibacter indicus]